MLAVIIFNIIEILFTILLGIILKTEIKIIAIIILVWCLCRLYVHKPMHYKSPIKCFIMTLFMFMSIFLATKVDVCIGIICVIFDNVILSKYANIKDAFKDINENLFQWNNTYDKRFSKYHDLIRIVDEDKENPILVKHEEYWKENYTLRYEIFNLFFKDRLTYKEIIKIKGFNDNTLIKNECKIIYSILEVPLNLKSLQ